MVTTVIATGNYSYLDIVNDVLIRLREPTTNTVRTTKNVVENMVEALVNDAYKYVWAAHNWTATQREWQIITEPNRDSYALDGTEHGARITGVMNSNGRWLDQVSHEVASRFSVMSDKVGDAQGFALVATPLSPAVSVRLMPCNEESTIYTAIGHAGVTPLSRDDDPVLLPYNAVMYYAYALAARERGEVGGQSVQEIFTMANQYISDAIALDANYASFEQVWEAV